MMKCDFCREEITDQAAVCPWCGRRQGGIFEKEGPQVSLFSGVPLVKKSWVDDVKERNEFKYRHVPKNVKIHAFVPMYPKTSPESCYFLSTFDDTPTCILRLGSDRTLEYFTNFHQAAKRGHLAVIVRKYCYPTYPILQTLLKVCLPDMLYYAEILGDICDGDMRGFISNLCASCQWKFVLLQQLPDREKHVEVVVRVSPGDVAEVKEEVRRAVAHYLGIPCEDRDFDRAAEEFMKKPPALDMNV
ncbi:MAG: hypothetical protein AB1746_01690 [Candidatus Zixiibacteriota bacterium]